MLVTPSVVCTISIVFIIVTSCHWSCFQSFFQAILQLNDANEMSLSWWEGNHQKVIDLNLLCTVGTTLAFSVAVY